MNNLFTKLFLLSAFLALFPLARAAAETHLQVDFETSPLFSEASFMPGDTVLRSATTTNLTTENIPIAVKAAQVNNADGLGDMMSIVISKGGVTLYTNTFTNFLSESLIPLGTLESGAVARYDFSVRFTPETGNPYQEKSVSFDILIGISGEGTVDEGCTQDCGGGGSSGGSSGDSNGGGPTPPLITGQGGSEGFPDTLGEILGAFTRRVIPKVSAPVLEDVTASGTPTTTSSQVASVFPVLNEVLGAWGTCFAYWLIIVIAIWILWFIYRTWNNNWERLPQRITKQEFIEKRTYFFIIGLVTAILIAYLISSLCVIPPLAFVLALFIIWFFINHASSKNSHNQQDSTHAP